MNRTGGICLLAVFVAGCPRAIDVADRPNGSGPSTSRDASAGTDGSGPAADGGDAGRGGDTGSRTDIGSSQVDAGLPDSGGMPGCGAAPYCFTLAAEPQTVRVREAATLTPQVTNPGNVTLAYSLCAPEPSASRRPMRPALVLSEIEHQLGVDAASGMVSFQVDTVPPWFFATRFGIELCAKGPDPQDPTVRASAEVEVMGNVLVSAAYQGIFAFSSDGVTARGVGDAYPDGTFIDASLQRATGLRLAQDGTLLVHDDGARPSRILRYVLTGPDQLDAAFAHEAAQLNGVDPLYYDNVAIFTIAELPGGGFAMADSHNSGMHHPRIMVWNADGSFRRQILGGTSSDEWYSVGALTQGEFLVGLQVNIRGQVVRVEAATGLYLEPPFSSDFRRTVHVIEPMPDGHVYVAGEWFAARLNDRGGNVPIAGLPDVNRRDWRAITRFGAERVLIANDHQGDTANVAIVRGTQFEAWFRRAGNSAGLIVPYGLVYLD